MGLKEFFEVIPEKLFLATAIVMLAPLPFYIIVAKGIAPPIFTLFFLNILANGVENVVVIIFNLLVVLILFALHLIVAYILSCLVYLCISKIAYNEKTKWIMLATFIILLSLVSLFNVYYIIDKNGMTHTVNILKLLSGTF